MSRRRRRALQRAMREAATYREWLDVAEALDAVLGLDAWRENDASPFYDATLLRNQLAVMQSLRAQHRALDLVDFLHESLYRHLGDLSEPSLYRTAHGGTKHLVTTFLDASEDTLEWLCDVHIPGIPEAVKLAEFERAAENFGRSALMLSGGATLGFYHLGVVKGLFESGLLPRIISGASTGAMIAAGVCSRTDDELRQMYDNPDLLRRDGLAPLRIDQAIRRRSMLDPEQLYDVLRHNIGDWTFAEAHARSGRALNIAVSATRLRQKPRLLTHLTVPDLLVASAALASSALPVLFPPVILRARGRDGEIRPYAPTERWIDGTVHGDLPKRRLSRLHNANHFIVSQTNPHVLPIAGFASRTGLLPRATSIATAVARSQASIAADVVRRASRGGVQLFSDWTHSVLSQDYSGDIDIHPSLEPRVMTRVVANPTREELNWFIREGERATWPRLAEIRDQTRISRTFDRCLARLRARVAGTGPHGYAAQHGTSA